MSKLQKTFSLQDIFRSTAFFAAALGIVCFNNRVQAEPEVRQGLFLIAIPTVGALLGAGIGVFLHRAWTSAVIGALASAVIISGCAVLARYR